MAAGISETRTRVGPSKSGSPSIDLQERSAPRLELSFECPHCGAPAKLHEDAPGVACTHCGSSLVLVRSDEPVVGLADCIVRTDEDLVRTFITRRLAEHRAALCSQAQGNTGLAIGVGRTLGSAVAGPAGGLVVGVLAAGLLAGADATSATEPPFVALQLEAEEKRLKSTVRLGERRLLHVPYWQVRGVLLQQALGRARGGLKMIAIRARVGEQSSPAYDGSWNFRDRGLRVGTARMRLLTTRDGRGGGVFLPRSLASVADRSDLVRRVATPIPDFDRLHGRGDIVAERRFLVYRPVWLAQFLEGGSETWLLVEGGTGIVGGVVDDAAELQALLAERGEDPTAGVRPARILLAPSRCVECGIDLPTEPALMRACPRCRAGLAIADSGVVRVSYDHVPSSSGDAWLPFWTWRFALKSKSGAMTMLLEDLEAAMNVPMALRKIAGSRLFVPAMRLLGTLRGEKSFRDLCEWLHHSRPNIEPGTIPGGRHPSVACEIPEGEARELARAALFSLLDGASVARLNAPLMRELLDEPELLLAEPKLVMAAVPSRLVPQALV